MAAIPPPSLIRDTPISAAAGYIAGTVMEQFNMQAFQKLEPEADQEHEQAVRPGPPYQVAARKISARLGIDLSDDQVEKAGLALHYLLPISWVPVYMGLRRRTGMSPLTAGLAMGAAMSAVADEGMTPLLGLSAPNRDYPLSTHVRAVIAHLIFGVSAGVVVEGAWRLADGD